MFRAWLLVIFSTLWMFPRPTAGASQLDWDLEKTTRLLKNMGESEFLKTDSDLRPSKKSTVELEASGSKDPATPVIGPGWKLPVKVYSGQVRGQAGALAFLAQGKAVHGYWYLASAQEPVYVYGSLAKDGHLASKAFWRGRPVGKLEGVLDQGGTFKGDFRTLSSGDPWKFDLAMDLTATAQLKNGLNNLKYLGAYAAVCSDCDDPPDNNLLVHLSPKGQLIAAVIDPQDGGVYEGGSASIRDGILTMRDGECEAKFDLRVPRKVTYEDNEGYCDSIKNRLGDTWSYRLTRSAKVLEALDIGKWRPYADVRPSKRAELEKEQSHSFLSGGDYRPKIQSIGDVNGDGKPDWAWLDTEFTSREQLTQRILVFLGDEEVPSWGTESDFPAWPGLGRGRALILAHADLNGDGFSDLLQFGLYHWTPRIWDSQSQEVMVHFGGSQGLSVQPSWRWKSSEKDPSSELTAFQAGDINGDGIEDLVLKSGESGEREVKLHLVIGSREALEMKTIPVNYSLTKSINYSNIASGDLNGDGRMDLVIALPSAEREFDEEGVVNVYYSRSDGYGSAPDWRAFGGASSKHLGTGLRVKDSNGDGLLDLVVGFGGISNEKSGSEVYLGRKGGLMAASAAPKLEGGIARLRPVWVGGEPSVEKAPTFERRIQVAGDLNGDGHPDLLAYATGGSFTDIDGIRVHYGGTSITAQIICGDEYESCGLAAKGLGDMNDDGIDDLALSSIWWGKVAPNRGTFHIRYGSRMGLTTEDAWSFTCEDGAYCGNGLEPMMTFDVDGDGKRDFLFRKEGDQATYVFHHGPKGLANAPLKVLRSPKGLKVPAGEGAFVGGVDVNGDGREDLWIGDQVYLAGPRGVDLGRYQASPVSSPARVLAYGDLNGDGFKDLVFEHGAGRWHGDGISSVGILFSGPNGFANAPGWTAKSFQENDRFGAAGAVLDINGDGFSDLAVGAPDHDNGQVNEGRVYVFLGSAQGLAITPAWVLELDFPNAQLGTSIRAPGDLDGDGLDDLVGGAWKDSNGDGGFILVRGWK